MATFSNTIKDTLRSHGAPEGELDDKARIAVLEVLVDDLGRFIGDAAKMIESLQNEVKRLRR